MKAIFHLALMLGLGLVACNNNNKCYSPLLIYRFKGFDSSDLKVVYIKHYLKGSGFKSLQFINVASINYPSSGSRDSLNIHSVYLRQDYDQEVVFPSLGGRTFRITEISLGGETYKRDGIVSEVDIDCTQSWSLKLDGAMLTYGKASSFHVAETYSINIQK